MRHTFWFNRVRRWLTGAGRPWDLAGELMRRPLPQGRRNGRATGVASAPTPAAGRPTGLEFSSGPGLMVCGPYTGGPVVWTTGDWACTCPDWTVGPRGRITFTGTAPLPLAGRTISADGGGHEGNEV
jgi:hypothetical protein